MRDVAALGDLSPEVLGAVVAEHEIEILAPPGTRPQRPTSRQAINF